LVDGSFEALSSVAKVFETKDIAIEKMADRKTDFSILESCFVSSV
jgi:hypothetical protein